MIVRHGQFMHVQRTPHAPEHEVVVSIVAGTDLVRLAWADGESRVLSMQQVRDLVDIFRSILFYGPAGPDA